MLENTTKIVPVSPGYSGAQFSSLFALNFIELTSHLLLGLPCSALNFFLICRTSILHPNLKVILLCQSVCIFVRGIGRTILIVGARFSQNDIATNGPLAVIMLYLLPLFIRNFIIHVLVIERVMATWRPSTYEKRRDTGFHIVWFTVVFFVSLWNGYSFATAARNVNTLVNLVTYTALLVLGGVEIGAFAWMLKYNERIYVTRVGNSNHSLSERYQLTENIRTARQLIPSMVLHFLNIIVGFLLVFFTFMEVFSSGQFGYDLFNETVYVITTLVSFLIELSMIVCHPFLKRDMARMLGPLGKVILRHFCSLASNLKEENRVYPQPQSQQQHLHPRQEKRGRNSAAADNKSPMLLMNLRGEPLVPNSRSATDQVQAQYFRQLDDAWKSDKGEGVEKLRR